MRNWPAVLSLSVAMLGAVQTATGSAQSTMAFVGANVLPMAGTDTMLPDHTVIVNEGRITAIGPRGRIAVPTHAVQIDARGQYLMPSLADMHVHLEHFDDPAYLQLFLIDGVGFVRSMDGRDFILDWKRRAAAGTLLAPHIYTAGQVLDGDPPVRDDNRVLRNAEDARKSVEDQASQGYDFLKVYNNLSAEAFRAVISAGHARGINVAGHIPDAVPFDEVMAAGMVSFEHLSDFANNIPAGDAGPRRRLDPARRRLAMQVDSSKMSALAEQIARSGTWVVPTMVLADRAVVPTDVLEKWMSDPAVAVIDRGILKYYWHAGVQRNGQGLDAAGWALVAQSRVNRLALVRMFRQAGVPMLIGTDTPQPFVFPGASVHEELANFVAAGFSPLRALAVATTDAARFAGQEKLWGTVEAGKRADLLLLHANPLQDITATRRIVGVMTQGQWLPASRLLEMRAAVEKLAAASQ